MPRPGLVLSLGRLVVAAGGSVWIFLSRVWLGLPGVVGHAAPGWVMLDLDRWCQAGAPRSSATGAAAGGVGDRGRHVDELGADRAG